MENLIKSSKLGILVSIEFQFQATARDRVQLMKKKINTQSKSFFSCIIYSFLMIWCRFPIPHSKWVHIISEGTFLNLYVCIFTRYLSNFPSDVCYENPGSADYKQRSSSVAHLVLKHQHRPPRHSFACLPMNFMVMRLLYLDLLDNHEIEEISRKNILADQPAM